MSQTIPSGITIPLRFACQIKFNNDSLVGGYLGLESPSKSYFRHSLGGNNRFHCLVFGVEFHQRLFALHSNPY